MVATRFTKLALATILSLVASSDALLTNPLRTTISRDIKTPDPVPQAGIDEAVSLMQTGRMYRYNIGKGEESVVSKCEVEIAEYTGHKYCVALNSCGSAIMLMMKAAGLQPGDEVLSNAFTFGAVPSAIEHAGGKVRRSEDWRFGFGLIFRVMLNLLDLTFSKQHCCYCFVDYLGRPCTWSLTTTTAWTSRTSTRSLRPTPIASSASSRTCAESSLIWML